MVNSSCEDREPEVKTDFTFLREVLADRRYAPHDESKRTILDTQELLAITSHQSGRVFISGLSN